MASEHSRFCVVDYTGYKGRRYFFGEVVKELAVYEPWSGRYESWLFQSPHSCSLMDDRKLAMNAWLERDIVKIKWDEGYVPYVLLPFILENAISRSEFVVVSGICAVGTAKNISGFLNDRRISVLRTYDLSTMPETSDETCEFHTEKQFCPLNRCLKIGDYISNNKQIKVENLQKVRNYYASSIPKTVLIKKMLLADPLSFRKMAKLYTHNFVNRSYDN
jgi:hypothetical protein